MNSEIEALSYIDQESGSIALVLTNSTIIEHEGELVPGIGLSPESAEELALQLIRWAMLVRVQRGGI